jgi:mitogen-activated protein kinase 1/3
MSTPGSKDNPTGQKRPRLGVGLRNWRRVRAVSKFIKLSIDVTRAQRRELPADDELYSLALAKFCSADKDRNGSLDFDEFRAMLLEVGVAHADLHKNVVQQYISNVDLNRDSVITFDEFLVCYKSMLKWDEDRFTLRAPLITGVVEEPPRAPPESSPLDNCPRIDAPPVLVGDVEFSVTERYTLGKLLGRGAYGVVASAYDTLTGQNVVVKRLAAVGHPIELQATWRELLILRHLRRHPHENLLALHDITPPPAGPLEAWRSLFLVMPRMDCDLHAIIRSNQPLSDEHCQFFSYQLLRGLVALHSCGIVHRDLKPSNLLVNKDCTLRIADFGISRAINGQGSALSVLEHEAPHADEAPVLTNYVVTRYYRAPELLLESSRYGYEVDIWSVASIVAEMILRRPLWSGSNTNDQLQLIASQLGPPTEAECAELLSKHSASTVRMAVLTTPPDGVSAEEWATRRGCVAETLGANSTFGQGQTGGIELAASMLRYLPSARPSADESLKHPWLSELHECNEEPRLPPIMMPNFSGRGISRKNLQLAAIESVRELLAAQPTSQAAAAILQR